jgi:hypothetical protein
MFGGMTCASRPLEPSAVLAPSRTGRAGVVEETDLVPLGAPIDRGVPACRVVSHNPFPPCHAGHHGAGWNLYRRSERDFLMSIRRGQPPGRRPKVGARGTSAWMIAPNRLARTVSLHGTGNASSRTQVLGCTKI